jgi:hypothetical protein
MQEPQVKRAVAFFDGQNLFYAVKEAFGYRYPNYEPSTLAAKLCADRGWALAQTRFYSGIPDRRDDVFWNHFWENKLLQMGRAGTYTFTRKLRYRNQTVRLPDGSELVFPVAQEKGIDVRIALDVVRLAHRREYDVALVFSQDQDLREVADEIREISKEQDRWIKMASAFPSSPTARNERGINRTDWVTIDRATYDACIDPRDYRPKTAR